MLWKESLEQVVRLHRAGEYGGMYFTAFQRLQQPRERRCVLRKRPAVGRNFQHAGTLVRDCLVQFFIAGAIALHNDTRTPQVEPGELEAGLGALLDADGYRSHVTD